MRAFNPRAESTAPGAIREPDVQEFLHRFAWAITTGDGKAAATLWALPSLIISDTMVQTIMDRDELERMFGGAREQYNARGIHDTRGEIQRVEWLSDRVVTVHVRWPHLSVTGNELGEEHATYLLRRDDHGDLKLHVAITRPAP
jgi:hypothetical protein